MSLRTALIALFVVVVGLSVADIAVTAWIEREAARRVAVGQGTDGGWVDIRSFPLVPSALVTGYVRHATVSLDDVGGSALPVAQVRVVLDGVRLDRFALLRGELKVDSVDTARILAELSEEDLSDALGVEVDLEVGEATATMGAESVEVDDVEVEDRVLVVSGEFGRVTIGIPDESYLPCEPSVAVLDDRLGLFCETDRVPAALGIGGSEPSDDDTGISPTVVPPATVGGSPTTAVE